MRLHPTLPVRRRGTILIVVLALLALFAVIGLSFVLYAGSEATGSRIYREAQDVGTTPPNPDGDLPAIMALGDLIYDQLDDQTGMYSAARGHSLARSEYGWYYTGSPSNPTVDATMNTTPFAGVGAFEENITTPLGTIKRSMYVNPSLFPNMAASGGAVGPVWPGAPSFPTPERTGNRTDPNAAVSGNYVGMNANYTYPDANNLFLGLANPLNGEVLIPSYYRPWIFAQNPADPVSVANALNPAANTNWTNPLGRYLTLRPRPIDQNNGFQFPYPPPNADGTVTGDVQNLAGSVYPHAGSPALLIPKNDSIWVDFGAPVQTWNGKKYKPLFAMLVLPLDNRVNLSVSGNIDRFAAAANPLTAGHSSNQGFGPWEINPQRVFNDATKDPRAIQEYQRLIMDRYGNFQASGTPTSLNQPNPPTLDTTPIGAVKGPPGSPAMLSRLYSTATSPDYAPLDWDGAAPTGSMKVMLPGIGQPGFASLSPFATTPRWNDPVNTNNSRYGNGDPTSTALDGEKDYHPSLFNPYFVGSAFSTSTGHTLDPADMGKLNLKFGDDTGLSTTSTLGYLAPYSFGTFSTSGAGISFPVGRSPANANRMNVTTISNSLAVPALVPNYQGDTKNYSGYQFAVGQPYPTRTLADTPALTPGVTGPDVSVAGQTTPVQMRAIMSYLQGSVDLNRPLHEYRPDPMKPLGPNNVYPSNTPEYLQAWSDRQLLARDIYNRLVVATGASAALDTTGTGYMLPTATVPGTQFDALRYLAQLAVNIVDFIDADDISTAFVWNPVDPTKPLDSANFDPNKANATYVGNRVVFGVEKPKLVTNEVYAELVTNPNDTGNQGSNNFHVRFFVELLNPATNEPVPGKTIGTKPLPAVDQTTTLYNPATATVRPYQVVVCTNGTTLDGDLANRSNVTGMYFAGANAVIKYDFSNPSLPTAIKLVPNGGVYGDTTNAAGVPGIIVVGPDTSAVNTQYEFNPKALNAAAAVGYLAVPKDPNPSTPGIPPNQMYYEISAVTEGNITTTLANLNANKPTILLRRLANPYLPANDPFLPPNDPNNPSYNSNLPVNPYLTVDVFETMQGQNLVNDAVRVASNSNMMGAMRPGATPQPSTRYSFGRKQPLAGNPVFTTRQQPTPAETTNPQTTFFRHNGTVAFASGPVSTWDPTNNPNETLWFPFEWMVHLDRPLVNALEATFAPAVPSHQLTQQFITSPAPGVILKHQHLAPWTPDLAAPMAAQLKVSAASIADAAALYRGLELLTVKPWTYGTPNAGKVAGKININLITDPRVLLALADPQSGNYYTQVSDLYDPSGQWNNTKFVFGRLMEARRGTTPPNQAYQPAYDPASTSPTFNPANPATWPVVQVPGPGDTPFKSFGVATLSAPNTYFPNANVPGIQGVNSTPARTVADPNTGVQIGVFSLQNAPPHPYMQQELLRKIENNITTTSNTFAVYITVGFFEVTNSPPYDTTNRPALGKELFKDMPGDLRQKYYAVIDRT
ncbi:MAG TPA: hypothetical protein VGJ05_07085, partial [Fimbriiglobus sp.]